MAVATGPGNLSSQAAPGDTAALRPTRSLWGDVWRSFWRQRAAVCALAVLVALGLIAALAPITAPYAPDKQFRREGLDTSGRPLPPNARFWLGTDNLGRDLLSRVIWGSRISLLIGLVTSTLAVTVALLVGGAAGYLGGLADTLIMRFVDIMMSIPSFFVTLLMISIFEPSPWILIVAIALFGWAYPSRVFRAEVRSLRERDFILAARCLGIPGRQIFLRHLLPHMLPLVIIYIGLGIPSTIFAEAGLSFIGLGIPPPHPALGSMIEKGTQFYRAAPWVVLVPGFALVLIAVCFNMLGNGLRDAFDPTRRGR